MTYRHFLNCRITLALIASFLVGLANDTATAQGKKGGGGSTNPPPTGLIYYLNGVTCAMKPDGTGKRQVLPSVTFGHPLFPKDANPTSVVALEGEPCDRVQGGDPYLDRWFLCLVQTNVYDELYNSTTNTVKQTNVPHKDIFAIRTSPTDATQVVAVQLTDLFGIFMYEGGTPHWSNDSNEESTSFVGDYWGKNIADRFSYQTNPDGSTRSVVTDDYLAPTVGFRLPMKASTINAAWLLDADIAYRPTSNFELQSNLWTFSQIGSPDGSYVAGFQNNILNIFSARNGSTVNTYDWGANSGIEPRNPTDGLWSRDGLTIGFRNRQSTTNRGGIWKMPAIGGTPTLLIANTIKGWSPTEYELNSWSPDSKYLTLTRRVSDSSKGTFSADVMLLPSSGGTAVDLTADISTPAFGRRWVSTSPAP